MNGSSPQNAMVKLVSMEGTEFEVKEPVALMFEALPPIISQVIALPNISDPILYDVIHFCNFHCTNKPSKQELNAYYYDFLAYFDDLYSFRDLITAAYNLKIQKLLDLTTKEFVDRYIIGKTAEEMRAALHIIRDLTDNEEHRICDENVWKEM